MVTLEETAGMMTSEDYKERFKAEYYQLKTRYEKLHRMLECWDYGKLDFVPDCPRSLYEIQLRSMHDYLAVLEARAKIEKVEL